MFLFPDVLAERVNSTFATSGASILKNGAEFVIHGVNINGPGMPSSHKVAQDAALIGNTWKFNMVRVSCSVAPKPGALKGISSLDEIVRAFTARDIVVLISPRDHVGGFYKDPPKPADSPSLTQLLAWQQDVATRYKDNPNVWFEVMAGPGNRDNKLTSDDWLDVHERVIRAIRRDAGAQNIVVCEGYGSRDLMTANMGACRGGGSTERCADIWTRPMQGVFQHSLCVQRYGKLERRRRCKAQRLSG